MFRFLAGRFSIYFVIYAVLALIAVNLADAQALGPVSQALQAAESEARGSILTGVAGILGVIVLITVAAGVVRAITRSQ